MNRTLLSVVSVIFLLNLAAHVIRAQGKDDVTIGIVHDGLMEGPSEYLETLYNELHTLLGSTYNVEIPAQSILNADWSAENAAAHYAQLTNDDRIDVILGFGVVSSSVIARERTYRKPVIVLGIANPEIHNIAPSRQNSSGIHNFSYALISKSIDSDIDTFFRIYPYKKIGMVFFDEILNMQLFSGDRLTQTMDRNSTAYTVLPLRHTIDDILSNLKDIDAVYLGHLGKFEGKEKVRLIEELTTRGIPTFGFFVKDAQQGALAAMTAEENVSRVFRRIALNIEAVLQGEDLATLPVHLSVEERLTLNMETARRLGFSPDFSILYQAELLNDVDDTNARQLRFADVMQQAVQANLDLKIQELAVASYEKEVGLAESQYLPTLAVSANAVQIDKQRAEQSFGLQAERTLSGTASLQQVILSEQALANISIQKHLLRANEESREQVRLDIMLEAGEAYFGILQARSYVALRSENLNRIKTNLAIAKQREAAGYSSLSDVYRWESQLATETGDLIEAKNTLRLSTIELNRILHKPLSMEFTVQDVVEDGSPFTGFAAFEEDVKNPRSLQILTEFLVAEAILQSNEIQQLDASLAALQRSLESIQRQHFVPVVGLAAEADYVFSRGGAGSDAVGFLGTPMERNDLQWFVALSASLPLFRGGAIQLEAQQTRLDITKLEQQKADLVQTIELNVRARVLDLALSVANLDLSGRSAEFARKSYAMVQDAYSKGAVSIVELTDAQTNTLNAELAASNSVYEFHRSLLRTQRAISDFLVVKPPGEVMEFLLRYKDYLGRHGEK